MTELVLSNNTAASLNNVPVAQSITVLTEVLAARETRRTAFVQCNGPVYVGSTDGPILRVFSWNNKAALTLIPVAGTVEVRISEDYD